MPDPADYPQLPDDFAGALAQAVAGSKAALAAGYKRLQVDILAPDLKPDSLAYPFHTLFEQPFAFVFADAGAAALARHQWQQPDWIACDVNSAMQLDRDVALIFSMPSLVEIEAVEQLCNDRNSAISTNKAKDVPTIAINPQLQDTGTAGVGLSGRRLRTRFLNTLEPCYYLQSFGQGALLRVYPHPWTVWQLTDGESYELLEVVSSKPSGEQLAQIFAADKAESLWGGIRRFMRALQN
ncbi:DUF1995 family protein [Synechococcus sp. PCC 7336]|uniref:DUF1995 family protein n=1 Tax=Synechococcus sp. PCC 7336 TaxID=195250 RepID=UPI000349D1CE|nr:DUF1995 family protein [Synechococcus sp. PCC 7336]